MVAAFRFRFVRGHEESRHCVTLCFHIHLTNMETRVWLKDVTLMRGERTNLSSRSKQTGSFSKLPVVEVNFSHLEAEETNWGRAAAA